MTTKTLQKIVETKKRVSSPIVENIINIGIILYNVTTYCICASAMCIILLL